MAKSASQPARPGEESGTDTMVVWGAVREKSSTASPSSDPVVSKSVQRSHNVAPWAQFKPERVLARAVLFAAAFPSNAPVVPLVTGAMKSNPLKSIHVPEVRDVASRLY